MKNSLPKTDTSSSGFFYMCLDSKVGIAPLVISDAISVATSAVSDAEFQNLSLLALALARMSLARICSLIANHFAIILSS